MAATLSRVHACELAKAEPDQLGWRICLGRPSDGIVGLIRRRHRLRVVVGEPITDRVHPGTPSRVLGLARTLLVARLSARQTAGRLATLTMWPELDDREAPRIGVTVIDLDEDGTADIACLYAPSVLHAAGRRPIELLPPSPGSDAGAVSLREGERLIAYSASFLGSLPPEILTSLPTLARERTNQCMLWDDLAASRAPSNPPGTAAELVIITRSG